MDLFALKSLLLLVFFTGCCAWQNILPVLSPVDAIMGVNVTLRMQVDKPSYIYIIWNYSDGKEDKHVATTGHSVFKVSAPYEGRVSVNPTNGDLTLGPLKMEDSGLYSINIIEEDGRTRTGEIQLRVLGNAVLPKGPVEANLGEKVTLKTLFDEMQYVQIIWYYSDGKEQSRFPVGTVNVLGLTVFSPYEGRASINSTNGYLTLGPLMMEDSGFYNISILLPDGTVRTAETQIQILAPPETPKQCTGYIVALAVCAAAVVVLLAGLLFLYKWMNNKRSRPSNVSTNNSGY